MRRPNGREREWGFEGADMVGLWEGAAPAPPLSLLGMDASGRSYRGH